MVVTRSGSDWWWCNAPLGLAASGSSRNTNKQTNKQQGRSDHAVFSHVAIKDQRCGRVRATMILPGREMPRYMKKKKHKHKRTGEKGEE